MNQLPQISEAEYEVMKVLWNDAPISTNEVTDKLVNTTNWNPKTIHTLLKKDWSKRVLPPIGRKAVFSSIPRSWKKKEYLTKENDHF